MTSYVSLAVHICCEQAESLLNDLHARNSQRTTPKKINKRRFDFTVQKMHTAGSLGGLSPLVKTGSDDREDGAVKTEDGSCAAEGGRGPQVEEFGECVSLTFFVVHYLVLLLF